MVKLEVGPLFSYYGSKIRLSKHYPLPAYDTIIEPFAGGAGYSCKYYDRQIILYEKDEMIFSILDFLIKSSSNDILNLPLIPPDSSVDDFNICQEAKWLIGFWLANGKQTPNKRLSKWANARGEYPNLPINFWGMGCRERLANTVSKIKHWKVYNDSWEESSKHTTPATWFIDPPYQKAGIYYRKNCKSINFEQLGKWSTERNGQIIVCESLGADWLPFQSLKEIKGVGKGRKSSTEVIWVSENS
jgi:site-specific DNA-adenine methylase